MLDKTLHLEGAYKRNKDDKYDDSNDKICSIMYCKCKLLHGISPGKMIPTALSLSSKRVCQWVDERRIIVRDAIVLLKLMLTHEQTTQGVSFNFS